MRVAVRALPGDVAPEALLRRLAARARARGLPAPAALIGEWFGGTAVLAPSVQVAPVQVAPVSGAAGPVDGPRAGAPVSGAAARALGVVDEQPVVVDVPPGAVGGGWIGYLGYGLTDPGRWVRRLPLAAWGWADHVLRRDRGGRWWFEALVPDGAPYPHEQADELAALLTGDDPPTARWHVDAIRAPDRDRHERAVLACMAAIRAGEIYQANVCTRYELRLAGDPLEVFAAGVARHAPAHAAFLAGGWGALASLSPELFLSRRGGLVRSSPIKGTAPRDPHDTANAALLAASAKDRAENVMIVDLVRNDLGAVAVTGSVEVPALCAVEQHPGLVHLVSTVRATLRPDAAWADLLAASFPPGSVTGAPKSSALTAIADLEHVPRGPYCGAVGWVDADRQEAALAVGIRTFWVAGGRLHLGTGAGITWGSDADAEWDETELKARRLLSVAAEEAR